MGYLERFFDLLLDFTIDMLVAGDWQRLIRLSCWEPVNLFLRDTAAKTLSMPALPWIPSFAVAVCKACAVACSCSLSLLRKKLFINLIFFYSILYLYMLILNFVMKQKNIIYWWISNGTESKSLTTFTIHDLFS